MTQSDGQVESSIIDPLAKRATESVLDAVAASVAALEALTGRGEPEITLRVLKIAEEAGEAVAAWIGVTGQNPRKGITHTREDVAEELCDVVLAALVAGATLHANVACSASLIVDAAGSRRPTPDDEYLSQRLLDLVAQCGTAAEVRSKSAERSTQARWLRTTAAVALAIVAELGFDPAETLTAKARTVSARIAEYQEAAT